MFFSGSIRFLQQDRGWRDGFQVASEICGDEFPQCDWIQNVGKTGGDGIHNNRESGEAWAKPVIASIDQILAADIAARRKMTASR